MIASQLAAMRHALAIAAIAAAMSALMPALGHGPVFAQSSQVVVVVNGEPITSRDVEQRSKLEQLTSHKSPPRQELIQQLIDEKLKVQIAKNYTLVVTDKDVNSSYATIAQRMHIAPDQLTKALASSGVSAATLKSRIRSDITWNQLIRGKFQASLQVGEGEIQNIINSKPNGEKDNVGYEYHLRPVLFIVPKGASGAVTEARKREAEALRSRFQNCTEGIASARGLRDVAVRDPVVRYSPDIPQQFRDLLNKTEIGQLTAPDITSQGVEMFALCGRKPSDDTPGKRAIRDEISGKRFARESERFLKAERAKAMIEFK